MLPNGRKDYRTTPFPFHCFIHFPTLVVVDPLVHVKALKQLGLWLVMEHMLSLLAVIW
jgi:hypothetical protein